MDPEFQKPYERADAVVMHNHEVATSTHKSMHPIHFPESRLEVANMNSCIPTWLHPQSALVVKHEPLNDSFAREGAATLNQLLHRRCRCHCHCPRLLPRACPTDYDPFHISEGYLAHRDWTGLLSLKSSNKSNPTVYIVGMNDT